jgi:hypothetical protein
LTEVEAEVKKKNQKIILSACCAGVVTRQAHHTTSSPKGLGFLNVSYLTKNTKEYEFYKGNRQFLRSDVWKDYQ